MEHIIECENCQNRYSKHYFCCESCGSNHRAKEFWIIAGVLVAAVVVGLFFFENTFSRNKILSALIFGPLVGNFVILRKQMVCTKCGEKTMPGVANCPKCRHLNKDLAKNTKLSLLITYFLGLMSGFILVHRFFAKKGMSVIKLFVSLIILVVLTSFAAVEAIKVFEQGNAKIFGIFLIVAVLGVFFSIERLVRLLILQGQDMFTITNGTFEHGKGKRIL